MRGEVKERLTPQRRLAWDGAAHLLLSPFGVRTRGDAAAGVDKRWRRFLVDFVDPLHRDCLGAFGQVEAAHLAALGLAHLLREIARR